MLIKQLSLFTFSIFTLATNLLFKQITSSSSVCNVLALSGGGVYGAFECGIIANLFERNYTYDIISGISAGSINTMYLASIPKGEEKYLSNEFKSLWTSFTNEEVYSAVYFLNGFSMYDNSPLKKKLHSIFDGRNLVRPLIIGATSLKYGVQTIFQTEDIKDNNYLVDVLMASTAIPMYFPPYIFNNDVYVDGGLTSNVDITEAINYCFINYPNTKVNVTVVLAGKTLSEDSSIVTTLNTKTFINRLLNVLVNEVEFSELYHHMKYKNIDITVYEQKNAQGYNMLDFTATEELFNQGYNFTNVISHNL